MGSRSCKRVLTRLSTEVGRTCGSNEATYRHATFSAYEVEGEAQPLGNFGRPGGRGTDICRSPTILYSGLNVCDHGLEKIPSEQRSSKIVF